MAGSNNVTLNLEENSEPLILWGQYSIETQDFIDNDDDDDGVLNEFDECNSQSSCNLWMYCGTTAGGNSLFRH